MKTYTTRTDAEALALRDGRITLLVLPMPQPPTGCIYLMNGNGDKACCYAPDQDLGNFTGPCWVPPTPTSEDHLLPAPYAPGDVVGVKEAWGWLGALSYYPRRPEDFLYRADGVADSQVLPRGWHSAESMPDKAIRTRLTIQTVEARQVQGITEEQATAAGAERCEYVDGHRFAPPGGCLCHLQDPPRPRTCVFADYWDRRHPKLPYAGNPWAWFVGATREGEQSR